MEGKHELRTFAENQLPLEKVSCKHINSVGTHYLKNDVTIIVEEIEETPIIAEISNKYHIKGVYKTKLREFIFNLCYNYDDKYYVTFITKKLNE